MAKQDNNTIFWILGILILFLVFTQSDILKKQESGMIGLDVQYYNDGVEVFPTKGFSIVQGVYDSISFNIYASETEGVPISNLYITGASPTPFANALPSTFQFLNANEQNKLLWSSDLIPVSQFNLYPQPINFWVDVTSGSTTERSSISLTIQHEFGWGEYTGNSYPVVIPLSDMLITFNNGLVSLHGFPTESDIVWDGTYWWTPIFGLGTDVNKYDSNWNLVDTITIGVDYYLVDLNRKESYWYTLQGPTDVQSLLRKFDSNWNVLETKNLIDIGQMVSFFYDGSNWFFSDIYEKTIYKYTSNMDYTGISYLVDEILIDIFWDGTYWYGLDQSIGVIQYDSNWNPTGIIKDISGQGSHYQGIYFDGTSWFTISGDPHAVFKYSTTKGDIF